MSAVSPPSSLPADYEQMLASLSLRPGWTQLGVVTPRGKPVRATLPTRWAYEAVRAQLLRAGELVPMEEAERRVLALVNAGLAPRLATTPSIFLGMQLILPGEHAPSHRHTPAAARLAVEGRGGYTIVNGEKLPMEEGDLILTPPHHWHEHIHHGSAPMIWMDILDFPAVAALEYSYSVEGEEATDCAYDQRPDASQTVYTSPGVVPYRAPGRAPQRYPLMRFPWSRTRETLLRMSETAARDQPLHLMYVNPQTGENALESMCFSVRMLRPGEEVTVPMRSASAVFFVLSGRGETEIDGETIAWQTRDTLACPTFARVIHRCASTREPAFLLQVDDAPLQHKLGFYEDESTTGGAPASSVSRGEI